MGSRARSRRSFRSGLIRRLIVLYLSAVAVYFFGMRRVCVHCCDVPSHGCVAEWCPCLQRGSVLSHAVAAACYAVLRILPELSDHVLLVRFGVLFSDVY